MFPDWHIGEEIAIRDSKVSSFIRYVSKFDDNPTKRSEVIASFVNQLYVFLWKMDKKDCFDQTLPFEREKYGWSETVAR